VRKEPGFTHFVPTICGAALETAETLKSVTDKQNPRAKPMCFFTNILCDPFERFRDFFACESFVTYFSFCANFQTFCSGNSFFLALFSDEVFFRRAFFKRKSIQVAYLSGNSWSSFA